MFEQVISRSLQRLADAALRAGDLWRRAKQAITPAAKETLRRLMARPADSPLLRRQATLLLARGMARDDAAVVRRALGILHDAGTVVSVGDDEAVRVSDHADLDEIVATVMRAAEAQLLADRRDDLSPNRPVRIDICQISTDVAQVGPATPPSWPIWAKNGGSVGRRWPTLTKLRPNLAGIGLFGVSVAVCERSHCL